MKGLKLLLLTFATLAITACSDDTTDEWHGDFGSIQVPDTRQLSQKIPAGQTAGNSEIFFSTNDAWNSAITDESRAEAPTWVRINPDHGDAAGDYDIRVETDPNTAEESRTAFIEITCGTNSILITITQSGTDGEDTNEPDEPNIGEQVRYWQLHKIVGRDASGSLIAEMEYTYELPAEFSKECRITGFKISAADKNGTAPVPSKHGSSPTRETIASDSPSPGKSMASNLIRKLQTEPYTATSAMYEAEDTNSPRHFPAVK